MFVDPTTAVSVALVWIRELGTIGLIAIVGWNARAGFQFIKDAYTDWKDFTSAVRTHMHKMEIFAYNVESNHMRHMEDDLAAIAGRRPKIFDRTDPNLEPIVEVAPPESDDACRL